MLLGDGPQSRLQIWMLGQRHLSALRPGLGWASATDGSGVYSLVHGAGGERHCRSSLELTSLARPRPRGAPAPPSARTALVANAQTPPASLGPDPRLSAGKGSAAAGRGEQAAFRVPLQQPDTAPSSSLRSLSQTRLCHSPSRLCPPSSSTESARGALVPAVGSPRERGVALCQGLGPASPHAKRLAGCASFASGARTGADKRTDGLG